MTVRLTFGEYCCFVKEFVINGIEAEEEDFGGHYDIAPNGSLDYGGCGNMQFVPDPCRAEVLEHYGITEEEYAEICDLLSEGLSFGCCGLCS